MVCAKAQSGALSVSRGIWQSGVIACCIGAALWGGVAVAGPDGLVSTLRRGDYACELPGDALATSPKRMPQEDFTIRQGSIYTTATGRGSYLATGDEMLMTSGPRQGERYRRISQNALRKLTKDGRETTLRCIRKVLNNNAG